MNRCIGCGIKLQNEDKLALGYTNKLDNKYCERCFRTIFYNEEKKVTNMTNEKIIEKINKFNFFTIFVTDFLNLTEEVLNIYKKINNKKILIINKCELIPNNLKLEKIEKNIKNNYQIEEVFFISAKNNWYLERLKNIIESFRKVLFCGPTGVGKSTIINRLFNTSLTTSKYENTTLDFIKLKKDDLIIYDSPGFNVNYLEYNKIINVTKQLKEDFVLNIDGLKIKGNGNITLFISDKSKVLSKREDIYLKYQKNIPDNSEILLKSGFIFVKHGGYFSFSEDVLVRKAII